MKKAKILSLLRQSDGYLSGQELCEQFGISRTAVWKLMNQLKEEGYEIEAVQNKGYRLVSSPDILSREEILSRLHTQWIGQHLVYKDRTGSTNLDAKRAAEEGAPEGTVIVTQYQESGRGRRGRSWASPDGCNVYFTLLLYPRCAPAQVSAVTLLMAVAVAEAVEELSLAAGIKWPNDIVIEGKKVCGILTEMSMERDYIHHIVIGTGINVNQAEFPKELRPTATSLALEKGEDVHRAALLSRILDLFEEIYTVFSHTWDLSALMERYESHLLNKGRDVRVLDPRGEWQGRALGITRSGELLVERTDGSVEEVYAGEVSVRGIYGYV